MTEHQISSITESIIEEQGVKNAKFTMRKSTKKGEGYGSERTFVDVKGDNKSLHLLFKCEPDVQENMSDIIAKAFKIEGYFYGTLVPALEEFSKKKGVDVELPIARCYKTMVEEDLRLLVFQNLGVDGYVLQDSRTCMSAEELTLVMRQYGKLHATSMALKDQESEWFEELTQDMIVLYDEVLLEQFRDHWMRVTGNVIDVYCEDKSGDDYEKLKLHNENVIELFKFAGKKSKYTAILHGDCWSNNIMFKYDGDNKQTPIDAKLVDFQLCRTGSPTLDLSYIFYSAASKVELDKLESHLRTYHESFASRTKELGGDPNKVYPYEALLNDWRTYCKYGYTMAISIYNLAYREDDEVVDLNDITNDGDLSEFLKTKTKNADLVKARIVDLTKHMFENRFF